MADHVYRVVVGIRDPHDPHGRVALRTETIHASTRAEAVRQAKARHVGGRFTANYVTARIVQTDGRSVGP